MKIFRHHLSFPIVALGLVEAIWLFFVPWIAAQVRFDASHSDALDAVRLLLPRGGLWLVVMLCTLIATGLYSARQRARTAGIVVRILASVLMGSAALALCAYLLPALAFGRGLLGISAALSFLGIAIIRIAFSRMVDEEIFKRRVLVYGAGRRARSISQLRRRSDQRGFVILGYVQADAEEEVSVPPERVVQPAAGLLQFSREHDVDEIVVAMDERRRGFPVEELLQCRLAGIDVIELIAFLERETGKVRLDVLNPSWMIFSDGFRRDSLRVFSERAFDILASVLLLLFAWPFMLLAVLAIKLEDGLSAPIFYRQARIGLEGRVFDVLKFRSMRPDAEAEGRPQWAKPGDSRVTRVGAVIRKLRIDELPQILNVLLGDMSFVGPRPERPEFVEQLGRSIPYYRERHCVKPGITGWAQLCYPYGSSEHDAAEKLQYDLYYVKNHSLLFDLMILLQTAEVVLWGKGAR